LRRSEFVLRTNFDELLNQVSIASPLFCPSTFTATFSFCKKNISSGRRVASVLLLG
jgi:hypothetical protein